MVKVITRRSVAWVAKLKKARHLAFKQWITNAYDKLVQLVAGTHKRPNVRRYELPIKLKYQKDTKAKFWSDFLANYRANQRRASNLFTRFIPVLVGNMKLTGIILIVFIIAYVSFLLFGVWAFVIGTPLAMLAGYTEGFGIFKDRNYK